MSGWLARYDSGTVWFSFYPLCLSCLLVTRGLKDLCVVASGTVRFLFRRCYLSVLRVGLIDALWCWYQLNIFLFFVTFLYLCDERLGVLTPLCRYFFPFLLLLSCKFMQRGSVCRRRCYRKFYTFSLLSSCYFVMRWLVRRFRCYRQFYFLFSCKFVSTIETY